MGIICGLLFNLEPNNPQILSPYTFSVFVFGSGGLESGFGCRPTSEVEGGIGGFRK